MFIFNTKFFDSIINFLERWYFVFLVAILAVSSINIFYNLGEVPINSWDEARHGVNAYEMISRNNYIVSTYAYKNDYWNLKPPVSYWAIILGYKLVGFNALGLRIFSGIAALITIIAVAIFTLYKHGRLASLISTSVLPTTTYYILDHCSRSGDADAIFVMFFTLSMVSIALVDRNIKWLYFAGLSFALAFLTKSWHAGNILVIIALYLIITNRLFKFRLKYIAFFILSTIAPIFLWALLRYSQDGLTFFKTALGYDLISRTSRTLEGHIGGKSYYLEVLHGVYFPWLIVLVSSVLAIIALIKSDTINKKVVHYVIFLFLWITVPFLLYSIAKTKIAWYILPIYPAMAITTGAASSLLLKHKNRNLILQLILSFMFILALYKNERIIYSRISKPGVDAVQELLKGFGNLPQYRGNKIYIHHFEQSYVLSAELYANLMPVEGGMEGFLKDTTDTPLLLVTKDRREVYEKELPNLKIISENEAAYILTK